MAIGYYKLKRKLNVNGTVKEVYVAKVARGNVIDTDILAEEVAATCTASEGDVLMVLRNMEHVIKPLGKGRYSEAELAGYFFAMPQSQSRRQPRRCKPIFHHGYGHQLPPHTTADGRRAERRCKTGRQTHCVGNKS